MKILTEESEFHSPKEIRLTAKQYLYRQGDVQNAFYILIKGWFFLTTYSKQGQRQIIRSVLPGEILSLQLGENKPAIHSAIAVQDSVVCSIPDFIKMCTFHPELALKVVWVHAAESTLTELYMTYIAHRDAHEKIAFMALELYQRMTRLGLNNGYIIPFPLKQEDIADTLGLTAIHVNRTLHKLQEENLLSLHKHELTILNYEKLNDLVGLELRNGQ